MADIDISSALAGLAEFLGGKVAGKATEEKRLSDLATAETQRQLMGTQRTVQEQQAASLAQERKQDAETFASEAGVRQLNLAKPKALAMDQMSVQIKSMIDGITSGQLKMTPELKDNINLLMQNRNQLLSEITGVNIPPIPFEGEPVVNAQFLSAVSSILERQNVDEIAKRMGKTRQQYLGDLGKSLGLSLDVMESLVDPGYSPEEKAGLVETDMRIKADARIKGMDNVFELLKNNSILQYGQKPETIPLQKQAIIQTLIGSGVDPDEAAIIAMNMPVVTDAISELDKANIRADIWAKKLDTETRLTVAERQEQAANYRAQLAADTTFKVAKMQGAVDLDVANLNNLTKVQIAKTEGMKESDIPKARKNIADAINKLTNPAATNPLVAGQVSQYKGIIANNMSTIFKDQYQLDMTPQAAMKVLDFVLVPKKGAGGQVAGGYTADRWPIYKAEVTKQYIKDGGKDPQFLNYMLRAVFDEFGFGEGGAVYGPPALITKPKKKSTTNSKPSSKGYSGGAH